MNCTGRGLLQHQFLAVGADSFVNVKALNTNNIGSLAVVDNVFQHCQFLSCKQLHTMQLSDLTKQPATDSSCCRHQSHQAVCLGTVFQRPHLVLAPPGAHSDPPSSLFGSHPVSGLWLHPYPHCACSLCSLHSARQRIDTCCGLSCPGALQSAALPYHTASLVSDGVHQWLGSPGADSALYAGET